MYFMLLHAFCGRRVKRVSRRMISMEITRFGCCGGGRGRCHNCIMTLRTITRLLVDWERTLKTRRIVYWWPHDLLPSPLIFVSFPSPQPVIMTYNNIVYLPIQVSCREICWKHHHRRHRRRHHHTTPRQVEHVLDDRVTLKIRIQYNFIFIHKR